MRLSQAMFECLCTEFSYCQLQHYSRHYVGYGLLLRWEGRPLHSGGPGREASREDKANKANERKGVARLQIHPPPDFWRSVVK